MGTHRSKSIPSENNCLAKVNSLASNLPHRQRLLADLPTHSCLFLLFLQGKDILWQQNASQIYIFLTRSQYQVKTRSDKKKLVLNWVWVLIQLTGYMPRATNFRSEFGIN